MIKNIDFEGEGDKYLINSILEYKSPGYILKKFLKENEITHIHSFLNDFEKHSFQPYEGYKSMPRAFNYINDENFSIYDDECNRIQKTNLDSILFKNYMKLFQKFANGIEFQFASDKSPFSRSKTAMSFRFLDPEKGNFLLHCGMFFDEFNKDFYNPIRHKIDLNIQLSFFVMIQKPKTNCDIKVYNASWRDYKNIKNHEYFVDSKGNLNPLSDFGAQEIDMEEGDLLLFDGGNFWHSVPSFTGDVKRITMGGFITKFIGQNLVKIWA